MVYNTINRLLWATAAFLVVVFLAGLYLWFSPAGAQTLPPTPAVPGPYSIPGMYDGSETRIYPWTDPETGCRYLVTYVSRGIHLTPRPTVESSRTGAGCPR